MKFKDLHSNIKIRIYVLFAFGTVQAMTMPFMAVYFSRHFGVALTGVLLTIGVAASLFSGIIGGYYADRIGRKKIMVGGEAVFMISFLTMALANSPWWDSPIVTFIAFMVTNICWGIYGPADEAMLLDVTDSQSRPLMYSIFYWSHNLTMAVGASIGAFLFDTHRFGLFLTMSLVVMVSLGATIFLIQETLKEPQNRPANDYGLGGIIRSYNTVFRDRTFILYVIGGMLVMALEQQLPNYIGIRLAQDIQNQPLFSWNGSDFAVNGLQILGLLQAENTILVVLLAGFAARWITKFPEKQTLALGVLLFTVGYSVITVSSSPFVLFIAMLFATVGEVIRVPVQQSFLGDIAPSDARSSYVAVNGMSFAGSRMLASLGVVLGGMIPVWGMGAISLVGGVMGLLLMFGILPTIQGRRQQSQSTVGMP